MVCSKARVITKKQNNNSATSGPILTYAKHKLTVLVVGIKAFPHLVPVHCYDCLLCGEKIVLVLGIKAFSHLVTAHCYDCLLCGGNYGRFFYFKIISGIFLKFFKL